MLKLSIDVNECKPLLGGLMAWKGRDRGEVVVVARRLKATRGWSGGGALGQLLGVESGAALVQLLGAESSETPEQLLGVESEKPGRLSEQLGQLSGSESESGGAVNDGVESSKQSGAAAPQWPPADTALQYSAD